MSEEKREYEVIRGDDPRSILQRKVLYKPGIDEADISSPQAMEEWMDTSIPWKLIEENLPGLGLSDALSSREFKVFLYVGKEVKYLNKTYTSISDIISGTGMDKSKVSKAIKSLEEKGFIEVEGKNRFGVGSRVVAVNPSFFWKGDYVIRNKYQAQWGIRMVSSEEERLYSCPLKRED